MMFDETKELLAGAESSLTKKLASLKPAPFPPGENTEMELIAFDYEEKDDAKWKALLAAHLKKAARFEIHCWNDETEWIELALRYGDLIKSDWEHGKVVAGAVTPEFTAMLLNMRKPADTGIYNKMTPFFNLFLDDGFSSSHYGTEICIRQGESPPLALSK